MTFDVGQEDELQEHAVAGILKIAKDAGYSPERLAVAALKSIGANVQNVEGGWLVSPLPAIDHIALARKWIFSNGTAMYAGIEEDIIAELGKMTEADVNQIIKTVQGATISFPGEN